MYDGDFMILYIARHGETDPGQKPQPLLTETGFAQARLLGERMKRISLDHIFASTLIRAQQTAEETAKLQNKEVEILPDIFEVENGETSRQAYERAVKAISSLKERYRGDEKIILFAHGTFNNHLISAAFGFPVRADFNFCQENTGLTCIKFMPDGHTKAEFVNDYCHLKPIDDGEF